MGKDFKNELLYSRSRAKEIDQCLRFYYQRRYLFWKGWEDRASRDSKLAYRLSKLDPAWAWAGRVVHRALATQIKKRITSAEDALRYCHAVVKDEWNASLKELWREQPKLTNIFEHYYETDWDRKRLFGMLCDRIKLCILNFFRPWEPDAQARSLAQQLQEIWDAPKVEEKYELELFSTLNGPIPVPVYLDCVQRIPSRSDPGELPLYQEHVSSREKRPRAVVFDWKIGKPTESDYDQAALAAEAVRVFEDVPADRITVRMIYLKTGEESEYTFPDGFPPELLARIQSDWSSMTDLHNAPPENYPTFRGANKGHPTCKGCSMYELCYNTRTIDG